MKRQEKILANTKKPAAFDSKGPAKSSPHFANALNGF